MTASLFQKGIELFEQFRVNVEAEITYSDYTRDLLFPHKHSIKFTSRALLLSHPAYEHDDWLPAETIEFIPWESVHCLENVRGSRVTKRTTAKILRQWLDSRPSSRITFPFVHVEPGFIVLMLEGVPRSERSRGGKRRIKQLAEGLAPMIRTAYPVPTSDTVELKIDVFTTDPGGLPDVDRLSSGILDAFEGIVYVSDKQVTDLQPRVLDSRAAYTVLRCQTEPVGHFKVTNTPAGSLYPLALGVSDYYVIRISA